MDLNHKFRTGKYAGRTVGTVYKLDRRYFNWILENRPEMLKSHGKKKPQTLRHVPTRISEVPENAEDIPGKTIQPFTPGNLDDAF